LKGNEKMRFTGKCKIGCNGKYLTSCDDLRIDRTPRGWAVCGFTHNPDGQDHKQGSFAQNGNHYGVKEGDVRGCTIIDTPQFTGIKSYEHLEDLRKQLTERVPLKGKWGMPAEHFGEHFPIRFVVDSVAAKLPDGCFLYDIEIKSFSW
jgi:hypothetical protein